jgi:hypothetical protein
MMTRQPTQYRSAPPREPDAPPADAPPTQAELDEAKEPLKREEAEQLIRAGTKLRHKGADPQEWFSMTRIGDALAIAFHATPAAIDQLLDQDDLIVAE